MAEETKVEETKPDEAEDEKSEPAADESKDEPDEKSPEGDGAEKSPEGDKPEDEKPAEEDEPEAEVVGAEEFGAGEKFGAPQPPTITDTVFTPATFAKDGVTHLAAQGLQYTRADHFGRAAILHSDRNAGAAGGAVSLLARPTYTDRQLVDGDLNFVPVVGSGAVNPPR